MARPQEIKSVALNGRNLPLAALRDVLETRAGDLIDLDRLARDRAALETVLLARGFLGSSRIARALRGAALTGLDLLPAPRRFFARRMIFGPSALP